MKLTRKKRLPAALLATRSLEALTGIPQDAFQTREATSTLGITSAMHADPVLVVADLDEIVECGDVSRAVLQTALETMRENGAVVVTSALFLAERERWLGEALLSSGLRSGVRYMPPRVVMVTNFCGGVGKTTLSLALARHFRAVSGLATALVEVGVGGSSLNARIGQRPSLYDVVTQEAKAGEWEKTAIYASDNWEADSLAADERTHEALRQIARSHTLTIFDTFPTNPLWKQVLEMATDIIVVAAPRPDAVAQTESMLRKLNEETGALDPKPRIHLVLNQVRTLGERLPLAGQIAAWIGFDERKAERMDGRLAEPLLGLLYPGWERRKDKRRGGRA